MSFARLHQPFDAWQARDPTAVFIREPGREISVGALASWVALLQDELRSDGVRLGDRVLVVAENCAEHVALLLACSRIGAWSCGVNARMAPGEIAGFTAKAEARVVYFTVGVSEAAARHADQPGARTSVLPGLRRSAVFAHAEAEIGAAAAEVAAVIFTSGTTGAPKGVLVTHDGLLHFGRVSAQSRRLGPADRSYAYLPMTHIFGLGTVLAASLQAAASLVMRSKFDPADVLAALAHHGVSQLQGPPGLFARLLANMDSHGLEMPAAPQLRYLYAGAGPLDATLKQRVETRFGRPLHHGYGLSEYAGSLAVTRLDEWRHDTAAGHLLEGAEVRIVAPDGQDLPPGERGEIWIRGRGLMPGYFRDAEATAQVMRPGGWYASGDLGLMGHDGALHVVGRLKEMIIRSGFNVYPAEVESVLNAWPAVQAAAVVGEPEGDGNERVVAYVELRPGMALDAAALDAHLRQHLSPYKRPARVQVLGSLPLTASGKVLKRALPRA